MRPAKISPDGYAIPDNSSITLRYITLHTKEYTKYFTNVTVTCIHTQFLNINL
jgi:hypothetical protein